MAWEWLGPALGSAIGGGLSYLGTRSAGKNALEAARMMSASTSADADAALEAAAPWATAGPGGTADFDPDARLALQSLSPELADMYQGALTRSGMFGGQALQYSLNPFEAADTFYQQQQPFYQRAEDQSRTDLETKLLAQGRLGGTGGSRQQQGLEEAILGGQTQRRSKAFSQAQAYIDQLLGRESADIGTATGLLNIPMQYANLGRGIGGDLGQAAGQGLASRLGASKNLANVMSTGTPFSQGMMAGGKWANQNFGRNASIWNRPAGQSPPNWSNVPSSIGAYGPDSMAGETYV
jgi:hypothetical protein